MNQSSIVALQLTTITDMLFLGMRAEKEDLTALLKKLQEESNVAVNYCVVSYIFLHWTEDISDLCKSVEQIRGTVDEPVIWEGLEDYIAELLILQEELSHLEDSFRPYLHCPATDIPEHFN